MIAVPLRIERLVGHRFVVDAGDGCAPRPSAARVILTSFDVNVVTVKLLARQSSGAAKQPSRQLGTSIAFDCHCLHAQHPDHERADHRRLAAPRLLVVLCVWAVAWYRADPVILGATTGFFNLQWTRIVSMPECRSQALHRDIPVLSPTNLSYPIQRRWQHSQVTGL